MTINRVRRRGKGIVVLHQLAADSSLRVWDSGTVATLAGKKLPRNTYAWLQRHGLLSFDRGEEAPDGARMEVYQLSRAGFEMARNSPSNHVVADGEKGRPVKVDRWKQRGHR